MKLSYEKAAHKMSVKLRPSWFKHSIFFQMKLSFSFVCVLIAATILGFVAAERYIDYGLVVNAGSPPDATQVFTNAMTG